MTSASKWRAGVWTEAASPLSTLCLNNGVRAIWLSACYTPSALDTLCHWYSQVWEVDIGEQLKEEKPLLQQQVVHQWWSFRFNTGRLSAQKPVPIATTAHCLCLTSFLFLHEQATFLHKFSAIIYHWESCRYFVPDKEKKTDSLCQVCSSRQRSQQSL